MTQLHLTLGLGWVGAAPAGSRRAMQGQARCLAHSPARDPSDCGVPAPPVVEETQEVLGADASTMRCTQRSPRIFGPHFADWPDGAPRPSGPSARTQPYSCVGSCTAQWWAPIPRGSPFPGGAVPDAEGPYILLQFPRRWQ